MMKQVQKTALPDIMGVNGNAEVALAALKAELVSGTAKVQKHREELQSEEKHLQALQPKEDYAGKANVSLAIFWCRT